MSISYRTVLRDGKGEYEEKKSRFIANVYHVTNEEEVMLHLAELRKKYYDARHNCYAYILGKQGETLKSSDDGEPQGTAGHPILSVLQGSEVTECLIVVTRYFGGTLLGTGGLVRSYTKAAQAGLADAEIILKQPARLLQITTDYSDLGKLQYWFGTAGLTPKNIEYGAEVRIFLPVPEDILEKTGEKVTDITQGRANITFGPSITFADTGKEVLLFED